MTTKQKAAKKDSAWHRAAIVKELQSFTSSGRDIRNVFEDFVECAAISISNAVDFQKKREERYMEIIKKYSKEEIGKFPKMLAHVTVALAKKKHDVLGLVFHELELHNKYKGQFFTPDHIARVMAAQVIDEETLQKQIEQQGYVTLLEPACGAGAMVIAFARELKRKKLNYQRCLHATVVDINAKCVHMAYVQLSLLGIPAVVTRGNSLTLEEFEHWVTPMHVLCGWDV